MREWKKIPQDWGDEVMSNVYVRESNPLRGVLGQAARYLADGSCPIGAGYVRIGVLVGAMRGGGARGAQRGRARGIRVVPSAGASCARGSGGRFLLSEQCGDCGAGVTAKRFGRVAILDTDMHHGQGVQEIFYGRDDVLYVSIHGDPTNFYPVVAGFEDERGAGEGDGYNVNLPMPHGSSEAVFFDQLEVALRAVRRFQPDALVLALGLRHLQGRSAVDGRGDDRRLRPAGRRDRRARIADGDRAGRRLSHR